jgi:hypothetical protein
MRPEIYFTAAKAGDQVFQSTTGQSRSRGVLDTRFRGYDERVARPARPFNTLRAYGP